MKNVLITGGTRGIGRSLVEEFSKQGHKVAFIYKSSDNIAEEIEKAFPAVIGYKCDVSDSVQVETTVGEIIDNMGHVDILINNAGVSHEGLLSDMCLDEWNAVINTNLTSVFLLCKALIPSFVSRKSGKIINISSMWGNVGASCEVAYSASKAGINGFTKALAKELAPSGITVNAIAPGVIDTDMLSSFTEDDIVALREQTPLERLGKGADIAKAALFLAGDGGDFITGEILNVNGGFVI
jgi:3-oxoacyl-[acyl-carrier protein] reductase